MFKKRDAALAMFSGIMFGLIPIAVKYAMQYFNISIYIGLFYRYLTGTLFLLVPGMKCTKKEVLTRDSILYIGLVALLSAMTAIFLYSAYVYIAAGVASTIHYLYPFFVILGNWFFFHRPLKKQILTATMISFTGLVLLCAPSRMEGGDHFAGIILAIISAICFGAYLLLMDLQTLRHVNAAVFSLLLNMFCTVYILMYNLLLGLNPFYDFGKCLICFLPAGLFSMLAYLTLSAAVKRIGAVRASVLGTLEPVATLVGGVLVLQEHVSLGAISGCLLVLTASILVLRQRV